MSVVVGKTVFDESDDEAEGEALFRSSFTDAQFWEAVRFREPVDQNAGFDVRLTEEHCIKLAEFWMEAAVARRNWRKLNQ